MAARSAWKGFLKLNLVTVPVKAFTATSSGGGEVHLNQLHSVCNSRIQYKKTCPIHGEIPSGEIVSGYEYTKGQYVVVDTDEMDKLRSEDDKAINIETFVTPGQIDPVYFTGKTYYLVPDGPVGQKPYALLQQAMVDEERYAVAQIVLHNREQMVLLRPLDNLLVMAVLSYDNQVTKPTAFEEEAPQTPVSSEELKLAKTLIGASTDKKFDYARFTDTYTEKLTRLIEAKVAGEEIVAPPAHEHPHVINLMDALKQSLASVQKVSGSAKASSGKPPRKMAPSKTGKAQETRKRKSS